MDRGGRVRRYALDLTLCLVGLVVANSHESPPFLVHPSASNVSDHEARRTKRLCSSSPHEVVCQYEDRCLCRHPGCECSVQWFDLTFGQMVAREVEVDVNVSCSTLRRPGAFISNVAVTANQEPFDVQVLEYPVKGSSVGVCFDSDNMGQARESELCQRSVRLVPSRKLPNLEGLVLTSVEVRVGPGAAHCSEYLGGPHGDPWACESESPAARTDVLPVIKYPARFCLT